MERGVVPPGKLPTSLEGGQYKVPQPLAEDITSPTEVEAEEATTVAAILTGAETE